MADTINDENDNPRTDLKDLPRPEEELDADAQKQVQGGATRKIDYNRAGTDLPSGDDEATRKIDYSG